jgi:site-specific recombinase XerD
VTALALAPAPSAISRFAESLEARNFARSTIRNYVRAAESLSEKKAPFPLVSATRADVAAWFRELAALGLSAETRSGAVAGVRAFFAWAVEAGEAAENPAAHSLELRIRRREREGEARWKGIRSRSMQRILSTLDKAPALACNPKKMACSLRDRALVRLLAESGMRAAEAAALRADEKTIDSDEEGLLSLSYTGKGGKDRFAVLGPTCSAALRDYLDARPLLFPASPRSVEKMAPLAGALFLTDRGTPFYGPKAVWRAVRRACVAAAVSERIHPHSFRHWRADDLIEKTGGNIDLVQQALGHEDPRTTIGYLSRSRETLRSRLAAAGALS